MTNPCVVCGGTDYSQPRGFYRQPGCAYEGGTVDQPLTGPYHFDCADVWQAGRKTVNRRGRGTEQARTLDGQKETFRRTPKSVTSRDKKQKR